MHLPGALLDPAVVLAADLALVEVRLRGVDGDERQLSKGGDDDLLNGMGENFSWEQPAREYIGLYEKVRALRVPK